MQETERISSPASKPRRPFWKRGDFLLLAAVLLAAALLFGYFALFGGRGGTAAVTVDGAAYGSYPLDREGEYPIQNAAGQITNKLVIRDGKAYMEWADCPDQICVDHAPIFKGGQSIICLPNRVSVEIQSPSADDIDGMAQ